MTRFLLIRHAYTGIKDKKQLSETALSDDGRREAEALAKRLKDFSIQHLLTSPYKRALETAKIIAKTTNLQETIDDRLREIELWLDPPDLYDDTSEQYQQGLAVLDKAEERVGELLKELGEKYQDRTIALVCHGNLIRAILGWALKMNLETAVRLKVDLVSISILEWVDEGYFRLALFNDTCHLGRDR